MNKTEKQFKPVTFKESSIYIPNVFELPKIGAGHDGYVFQYNGMALKVLKYDILTRKEKNLMTFDKARYFISRLSLKRFVSPKDILLDEDGVYCGYSMDFLDDVTKEDKKGTPRYKETSKFTCGDLISSVDELSDDVQSLNENGVLMEDLNRGSYIFTADFMHICDMDKFKMMFTSNVTDKNTSKLNFLIAKFLYMEMLKNPNVTKEQLKALQRWVKESANSRRFVDSLHREIGTDYNLTIGEYAEEKRKSLI